MATASLLSAAARRLEGKVALITGAASGIGECTARLFAKHGAKLILVDVQDDLGQSLSKDLDGLTSASFLHCDVTNETDIKDAVDFAVSKYGKLDIMFNNAGIVGDPNPHILETEKAQFEDVLRTNLIGPFLGIKHAAKAMIPAHKGSIINTASVASVTAALVGYPYTTSKHAVVGLTKNAAVELGRHGIRVNSISPYYTPTPLTKKLLNMENDEDFGQLYSNIKGSICRREDSAEAVLYLGSDESKYVSGHNLVVDGGFSVMNAGFCIY